MSNHCLLSLFIILLPLSSATKVYNVVENGANGDGKTENSKSFTNVWSKACSAVDAVNITVPAGTFMLGPTVFEGPCVNTNPININLDVNSILIPPPNYTIIASKKSWLFFRKVHRTSIFGGTIDANGTDLWNCRKNSKSCPVLGATSLRFEGSSDIAISGLKSLNSQKMHIVFDGCERVNIDHVEVNARADSPNTDGIHIGESTNVNITNSKISTGDDHISISPGSSQIRIEGVELADGHGISIGSLGGDPNEAAPVEAVTVISANFTKTSMNGLRIKSFANSANNGAARNIHYENIFMNNVDNPIIIDQHYCPDNPCSENGESAVRISDVTFKSIHGTSASDVAINFNCSKTFPCTGIHLEDIQLTLANGEKANATCNNAEAIWSGINNPDGCPKTAKHSLLSKILEKFGLEPSLLSRNLKKFGLEHLF